MGFEFWISWDFICFWVFFVGFVCFSLIFSDFHWFSVIFGDFHRFREDARKCSKNDGFSMVENHGSCGGGSKHDLDDSSFAGPC